MNVDVGPWSVVSVPIFASGGNVHWGPNGGSSVTQLTPSPEPITHSLGNSVRSKYTWPFGLNSKAAYMIAVCLNEYRFPQSNLRCLVLRSGREYRVLRFRTLIRCLTIPRSGAIHPLLRPKTPKPEIFRNGRRRHLHAISGFDQELHVPRPQGQADLRYSSALCP